jgi:hypothetical protein
MSWLFKSKDQDSLRRDARAPAIAKHGKVVSVGIFHKRGRVERAYTAWTKRRFDIHDDCTLVYYDGDVYKGEIDLHEVTITFSADPENSVFSAKPYTATGAEIALDLYCPHGSPEVAPRRSVFGGTKKKSTDRTLQIILESPQDAALMCSTIATLDPDGLGNAQDFAAVQGWMMPRRERANPNPNRKTTDTPKKAIKMDSESEDESNGESDGESDRDEIDKMSWGALRETQESRDSSVSASALSDGDLRASNSSDYSAPASGEKRKKRDKDKDKENENEKEKEKEKSSTAPVGLGRLFPSVDSVEEALNPVTRTDFVEADAPSENQIDTESTLTRASLQNVFIDDLSPSQPEADAAVATTSLDAKDIMSSSQFKRRHSSFLNAVWNKLLPLGSSLRPRSGKVHTHGLLYVLTEPEIAAVTDRDAMLSVNTELQWQPRMFDITCDGLLRIQGGKQSCGSTSQCRISLMGIHVEKLGCAQVWTGRSGHRKQSRYAGSSNNIFVDSLVHSPNPKGILGTKELEALPISADGLRNRKASASFPSPESYNDQNPREIPRDTMDSNILGAVRFSDVKTVPLLNPTVQTRASASAKSVQQLPEEAHNPRQRLLHTPTLRLSLPSGEDVLVTFLPPDLQYANVLRDDRYNLSYALHLQVQLRALEEASVFLKALKEVSAAPQDPFDNSTAVALETAYHELHAQRDSSEIAQYQFTSAFNGSATKSASNVFIFIWCVWLMLTTLRPSAMNIFVFAIATYAFIYAQKWLGSEDGERIFAGMQQRMRENRLARGDTIILMKN